MPFTINDRMRNLIRDAGDSKFYRNTNQREGFWYRDWIKNCNVQGISVKFIQNLKRTFPSQLGDVMQRFKWVIFYSAVFEFLMLNTFTIQSWELKLF